MTAEASVVVIDAGQSGLSTGYYLQRYGLDFTILAADSGDPVFSDQHQRMRDAGIVRVDRITGLTDGRPVAADGEVFTAPNVVWATGFQPHYPWIELDVFDDAGEPRHVRGVVEGAPGLYFVGLHWQSRPDSSLIGGVGRDAKHVAERVQEAA